MISAEKIALMKKSAIFINCARGPIVDSKALAQALNEGRIAGAAVDVFDCEPPIPAEEPLLHAKNTLLTPHVAFLSCYSSNIFARRGIMNPSNEPSQFKLHSEYQPTGDQPQAIAELVEGFRQGNQFETLLGVTGSGKTFTMANVIQALNKPTLIIAHNKTLAG